MCNSHRKFTIRNSCLYRGTMSDGANTTTFHTNTTARRQQHYCLRVNWSYSYLNAPSSSGSSAVRAASSNALLSL